jgi:PAS domain S-box-containing protein
VSAGTSLLFYATLIPHCRYFDELKSLLPPMQDTKFDKNSILVNSITLIKALRTELAAAQTLRCTGAIGDPTQCKQANEHCCMRPCDFPPDASVSGNEYHESFTRSGMCQAFAGFDGRIWEANLTFCVVLGYSALDVAHLTILSITARDDVEESRRYSGLLLSGSGQKECSYRAKLVRKDGTTLVCSIELVVLEVEGQPYCFLFTAHPPNGAGQ